MDSISEVPPSPPHPPPPPPPAEITGGGEIVGTEPDVVATPAAAEQVYSCEGDAASLASVDR